MVTSNQTMTAGERAILDRLLGANFPGAEQLRGQASNARVTRTEEGATPVFLFAVLDSLPVAETQRRIPVEAQAKDSDGVVIHFLIHVVGGRLQELETYREDGLAIKHLPDARELDILIL